MSDIGPRLLGWAEAHVPNAVRIVLIPLVAWLLSKLVRKLIRRLERLADDGDPATQNEAERRAATLGRVLRQVSGIFLWGTAAMLILSELGVSLGPILAGAGIAGLAVGFGAQALVKDVIAGFFILLENQFRVGDVIETAGVAGAVEAINLRTTVLRDVEGRIHVVPNGTIAVVTNLTHGWSRAVVDVGVPYEEDTDRVLAVLREVGAGMESDPEWAPRLAGAFQVPGIERLGDSSVVVRILVDTKPLDRFAVAREMRRRVKRAFDEAGISIPFPQLTVHLPERPPARGGD